MRAYRSKTHADFSNNVVSTILHEYTLEVVDQLRTYSKRSPCCCLIPNSSVSGLRVESDIWNKHTKAYAYTQFYYKTLHTSIFPKTHKTELLAQVVGLVKRRAHYRACCIVCSRYMNITEHERNCKRQIVQAALRRCCICFGE